jgi:hypothetical protein
MDDVTVSADRSSIVPASSRKYRMALNGNRVRTRGDGAVVAASLDLFQIICRNIYKFKCDVQQEAFYRLTASENCLWRKPLRI